MANITTNTPVTYSMKVDNRTANNFEATNTEQTFEINSIAITPAATVTGAETNYQINEKGEVLPGTLDIKFTLANALLEGRTLGWRLEASAPNTDFTYGTNYTDEESPEFIAVNDAAFAVADTGDTDPAAVHWQDTAALASGTEITIPVKVNYVKTTPTPGDAITFTVKFFIKSVIEGLDDVIYTAGESGDAATITVYTSVLTADITTLAYNDISTEAAAFNVGDRIIFKTVLTADKTNSYYRQPVIVNFTQTMDPAITASTIYVNAADIASTTGADLASAAKTIAVSNNDVQFTINGDSTETDDASLIQDGFVKNLYVWVIALINKIPV